VITPVVGPYFTTGTTGMGFLFCDPTGCRPLLQNRCHRFWALRSVIPPVGGPYWTSAQPALGSAFWDSTGASFPIAGGLSGGLAGRRLGCSAARCPASGAPASAAGGAPCSGPAFAAWATAASLLAGWLLGCPARRAGPGVEKAAGRKRRGWGRGVSRGIDLFSPQSKVGRELANGSPHALVGASKVLGGHLHGCFECASVMTLFLVLWADMPPFGNVNKAGAAWWVSNMNKI